MKYHLLALTGAAAIALAGCGDNTAAPADTATEDAMATDAATDTAMAGDSTNPMVGGAPMLASETIVANASNAPNLSTLVSAVKQADLVETLSGPGPYTVFAPTNEAFSAVPKATLDSLMKPDNKDQLKKVLTYHVVPGKVVAADLVQQIKDGNGTATLKTVEGDDLTATMDGQNVKLTGKDGSTAIVTTADVMQSNGVVHVIDGVLTPTM